MTTTALVAALTDCAVGIYPLEAGVALLTEHGTSSGIPMATINWDAAITALHVGELPFPARERRILVAAASLAADIPADVRDATTGLDTRNLGRLIAAIAHLPGRRPQMAPGQSPVT